MTGVFGRRSTHTIDVRESGRRSGLAATLARRAGLVAHNVDGGVEAWTAQPLPIEQEPA